MYYYRNYYQQAGRATKLVLPDLSHTWFVTKLALRVSLLSLCCFYEQINCLIDWFKIKQCTADILILLHRLPIFEGFRLLLGNERVWTGQLSQAHYRGRIWTCLSSFFEIGRAVSLPRHVEDFFAKTEDSDRIVEYKGCLQRQAAANNKLPPTLHVFLISSILHHHPALLHRHALILDCLLTFLVAFSSLVLKLFFSRSLPFLGLISWNYDHSLFDSHWRR